MGHRHYSKGGFAYPDGGNPWCLSRAALELWRRAGISRCSGERLSAARARQLFGPESHEWANCRDRRKPGLWCAEDIFLFFCLRELGVRFVHYRGKSWPPQDLLRLSFEPTFARSVRGEVESELVCVLTFSCVFLRSDSCIASCCSPITMPRCIRCRP